jgi:uncharacterized RDD family membrane protein YckC
MIGKITYLPNKIITVNNSYDIIVYKYASFGARLGARLIDILIIIIPSYIIPIIPWLYWSLQHSSRDQATVGQKFFNLKTISVDGTKITFIQATGRFFGNFLNALTLFFGFFMFFFTDKNQCLHDMLSGCIVVKEIDRGSCNEEDEEDEEDES